MTDAAPKPKPTYEDLELRVDELEEQKAKLESDLEAAEYHASEEDRLAELEDSENVAWLIDAKRAAKSGDLNSAVELIDRVLPKEYRYA